MPSQCLALEIPRHISKQLQFQQGSKRSTWAISVEFLDGKQQEVEKPGDVESGDLGLNRCSDTALLYDLQKVT